MSILCTYWLTYYSSYIIYRNLARPPWGREGLLYLINRIYIIFLIVILLFSKVVNYNCIFSVDFISYCLIFKILLKFMYSYE